RASAGTPAGSPFNWSGESLCKIGLSASAIFTSALGVGVFASGFAGKLSAVSHGSGLGRASSTGGLILNGMRTGAGGDGKRFGTDGPLEAGTLSGAGASVPFGESLKGIRVGVCVNFSKEGRSDDPFPFVPEVEVGSGSAAAKASAVGGSTRTVGRSP